jgi:hypothetical protein
MITAESFFLKTLLVPMDFEKPLAAHPHIKICQLVLRILDPP